MNEILNADYMKQRIYHKNNIIMITLCAHIGLADVVKIYDANENRKFVKIWKFRISLLIGLLFHVVEGIL